MDNTNIPPPHILPCTLLRSNLASVRSAPRSNHNEAKIDDKTLLADLILCRIIYFPTLDG